MDIRQQQLKAWLLKLAAKHSLDPEQLEIASADASFRRYFRARFNNGSCILMDAP
ncbi:MAG: aminoglycoside phosphotransferase, partial [Betaproteobacteria bacterium]|nr:aminoglycoside phosphotransferase [Betaproteobacteria bacterium]